MSAKPSPSTSTAGRAETDMGFSWSFPLVIAAVAVLLSPGLMEYFSQLWSKEYYQFFPFLLASVIWFSGQRAAANPNLTEAASYQWWFRGALFLAAETALLLSFMGSNRSPLLFFVAFVAIVFCVSDFWPHRSGLASSLVCVLPLTIIIRPPFDGDQQLIQALQIRTTTAVSLLLDSLQIAHIRVGNVLEMSSGTKLGVAEACSGVQSFYAMLFIAAFIGLSRNYRLIYVVLLMSVGTFWAFAMNVCRVLVVALADVLAGVDLVTGWQHELVGYVTMLLAIPMLLSTDRLLEFIFSGVPDDPAQYRQVNIFVLAWNHLFGSRRLDAESSAQMTPPAFSEQWKSLGVGWRSMYVAAALVITSTAIACSI